MYNWNDSTFAKISWKWNKISSNEQVSKRIDLKFGKQITHLCLTCLTTEWFLQFLRFLKNILQRIKYRWCDYLGSTLTLMGIFKIEQAITALSAAAFLQIFEEGVVSRVARSDDFDIYLPFVFDVEDHISVLFVFLYLFVRCLANVCDCYSRCLVKHRWT